MGIIFGKDEGMKREDEIMKRLNVLRTALKEARSNYKTGYPGVCHSDIGRLIMHAEKLRKMIEKEHPEYSEYYKYK